LSINDYENAFVKLFRAGEFYFAFAFCKLLYEDGLPLLYSILGEKCEIYGSKEEVIQCFKNSVNPERYHFLNSNGELPEHIREKTVDADEF
jgi:hypothetical protein